MEFLEKNLEDIIWESDRSKLKERGLNVFGKAKRQLKIGNYGIADLVCVDRRSIHSSKNQSYLDITVYELKRNAIGVSAFFQAIRYCKGIQSYLNQYHPNIEYNLNIVLIGDNVDTTGSFCYIPDLIYDRGIEFPTQQIVSISFYSYKYKIDGIWFEYKCQFNLIDEGF